MTLYKGTNLIAGSDLNISKRSIGELVTSIVPLNDAGLHLLDGSLIQSGGSYGAFVDYMANLYTNNPKYSSVDLIGSVVDNDGIVSGFSASPSSYLLVNNLPTGSSTIEIVQKLTTPSSFSATQNIIAYGGEIQRSIAINILTTGALQLYVSNDGSSWNVVNGNTSTLTLSTNTTYYIKISYDGTQYKIDVSTTGAFSGEHTNYLSVTAGAYFNNTTFTDIGLWMDSTPMSPILGTIDLNGYYINMNGSRVWTGRLPVGFIDESIWQQQVAIYGVCGKFVYNSTNNTVRLPKISGFIEGANDINSVSKLTVAGLPNIVGFGDMWVCGIGTNNPSGAYANVENATVANINTSGSSGTWFLHNFDASRCSVIYGGSSTVQPQSIKVLYYVVIATSTKTNIEVDIDQVATDLNGKADVDFTNINATGKSAIAKLPMPSTTYNQLTIGASGTSYTAPANGWVNFDIYASGHWIALDTDTIRIIANTEAGTVDTGLLLPVVKNQSFTISYDGTPIVSYHKGLRFIYSEGEI